MSKKQLSGGGRITGGLVADLKDPNDQDGRSYREVNNATSHKRKIGDLVEMLTGVRLFVVSLNRDCDGTPLYCLSPYKNDTEVERKGFRNPSWISGYGEEGLRYIK